MLKYLKKVVKWYLKEYSKMYPDGYYPPTL